MIHHWRIIMNHLGEYLWDLLKVFNGIAYVGISVLAINWLWLLLQVVADAVAPLRECGPNLVNALPEPSDPTACGEYEQPTELETELQPDRRKEGRKLCA